MKQAHRDGLDNNSEGRAYEPSYWTATIGAAPVTLKQNKLYSALTLTGRGTLTVEGSRIHQGQFQRLAVKIYWPEEHRAKENVIITFAGVIAQWDSDIANHLPTVFASQDSRNTSRIRHAVGLEAGKSLPLPTLILSPRFPKKNLFVLGLIASVVGVIKTHSSLNN